MPEWATAASYHLGRIQETGDKADDALRSNGLDSACRIFRAVFKRSDTASSRLRQSLSADSRAEFALDSHSMKFYPPGVLAALGETSLS